VRNLQLNEKYFLTRKLEFEFRLGAAVTVNMESENLRINTIFTEPSTDIILNLFYYISIH